MKKYTLLEDLLSPSYHLRLRNLLSEKNGFPWYFLSEDVTYSHVAAVFGDQDLTDPNVVHNPQEKALGFTHLLINRLENIYSPWLPQFEAMLDTIKDRLGAPDIEFQRVRLALQLSNGIDHHNRPHTDHEIDHYAGIYYFHDSSGDTVLFNQYDDHEFGSVDDRWQRALKQEYDILHRNTPKANSLFLFNGHQFHASSNPTTNPFRVICNFNFTTDYDILSL